MTEGAIMPPISLAELKKLQKNGKGLYHNEKFDEFCTLMGKVASKWAFTYKRPYQNKLQEFSDALYAVKRDPNDPEFRYSIEDSLDVLDGLGRFLFQKAPRGQQYV